MKRTRRRWALMQRPMTWVMHRDHSVEPEEDLEAWGRWMAKSDRRVALHWWVLDIDGVRAGIRVSTVFLGVDHNHMLGGRCLLFESMIFGGPHTGDQRRYASWDAAVRGHWKLVTRERSWLEHVGERDATFWEAGLAARGGRKASALAGPSVARIVASGTGDEGGDVEDG